MACRKALESMPKLFGQDSYLLTKALFSGQESLFGVYGQYQQCYDYYGVREASTMALKQRMRSVKNIEKITKAMKMVASSKMKKAQITQSSSLEYATPLYKLLEDFPDTDVKKSLIIPICTDKGLCGGLNSNILKLTRTLLSLPQVSGDGKEFQLLPIGEKARSFSTREFPKNIATLLSDVFRNNVTYSQASEIADQILKYDFEKIYIIYNHCHSPISFKPTVATVLNPLTLRENGEVVNKLKQMRKPGKQSTNELLPDLVEYQLSSILAQGMSDNHASEFASRVQAMDNSSKNAGEMLDKLTLQYNRSRQATITTELIEIISGAEALKG